MLFILQSSRDDFFREVRLAIELVEKKDVVKELLPFKQWLLGFYKGFEADLDLLGYYISLKEPSIYSNIFNELSQRQQTFRLINSKFLSSLYRHSKEDLLSLRILDWIQGIHIQTKGKPFLILDGDFGILPTVDLPLTYYFPVTSQYSLLHAPLFFHELGHYFYEYHRNEMDQLVKDFQKKLDGKLVRPYQTNDLNSEDDAKKNKIIVETWYEWMQELFCDAVGLEMGGSTYLKTFSQYLRLGGRTSFYVREADLAKRSHPVTMIRIRFLVARARVLGLTKEATDLEKEWQLIQSTLSVTEEYYGYYLDDYANDIHAALNDMLIEAAPMKFSDFNSPELDAFDPSKHNYLQLIYLAWRKYESDSAAYGAWEKAILSSYSI
jgi:hypothetical protein